MAIVDEITIQAKAGNGGNGIIHWLHTRESAHGGPDGGDGGKGGNVIAEGRQDIAILRKYRYDKIFRADDGQAGKGNLKHGADGQDVILHVPVGTVARVRALGSEYTIMREGERAVLLRGGAGGKGNAHFKSSTNQNPFQKTDGREGEESDILFTLKIIADAGLIGLPNAGKSSLLAALTRAKTKIADYPFTTLEPHLGNFYGNVLADIPGLIEGASTGRGLGIKFLKHIERTGLLLHLVSADRDDPIDAYREVRAELGAFGHGLADKSEIVILSKIDTISAAECETKRQLLARETGREVLTISVKSDKSVKDFSDSLSKLLKKHHK